MNRQIKTVFLTTQKSCGNIHRAPFPCFPEWLHSSSALHQFLFIPLILCLPPRCFIFQVVWMLQEIITPFIWSPFLSFVSLPLVFDFYWHRSLQAVGWGSIAGANVASQAPNSRSISREQEQTRVRGKRAGDKATREGVCVVANLCKPVCCATAARSKRPFKGCQLRNSSILTWENVNSC